MGKTISHLNSKIWYRLLKVAFVFSFLVACTLTVFIIFSSNYKTHEILDKQNTQINCQLGNKKQFSQKEIFDDENIDHFAPDIAAFDDSTHFIQPDINPQIEKILKFCEISHNELQTYAHSPDQAIDYFAEAAKMGGVSSGKPAVDPTQAQSILTPYKWEYKYTESSEGIFISLIYSTISLGIITLVFELIRRAFYYIILGTFKPRKE